MERSEKLLSRDHSVLVVVDLQDTLLRAINVGKLIAENIALLSQVSRLLEIPVILTTQNAQKLGGVMHDIAAQIENLTVVDKLCFSCVGSEEFTRLLQSLGRTQVVLTGIESHICILQTALDLLKAGYIVHVPHDAVASRQKRDWKYALLRMAHSGVIVTSIESVIYEWLYEAGTDSFRAVLPLLKGREARRAQSEADEEEHNEEASKADSPSVETVVEEHKELFPTSERDSEE
ncbi:MAG: isochorismatase family protein [Fimbriimonadales bacterium]